MAKIRYKGRSSCLEHYSAHILLFCCVTTTTSTGAFSTRAESSMASRGEEKKGGGEDGHDVVNIAPLGKREKKDRGGAKKDSAGAEGAPEVTTAST